MHLETETKGMRKRNHTNGKAKKTGVSMLISDKTDFKEML